MERPESPEAFPKAHWFFEWVSATPHVHPSLSSRLASVWERRRKESRRRERERRRVMAGGSVWGRDERETCVAVRMGEISRRWQRAESQISDRKGDCEYTLWIWWMLSFMLSLHLDSDKQGMSEKTFLMNAVCNKTLFECVWDCIMQNVKCVHVHVCFGVQ